MYVDFTLLNFGICHFFEVLKWPPEPFVFFFLSQYNQEQTETGAATRKNERERWFHEFHEVEKKITSLEMNVENWLFFHVITIWLHIKFMPAIIYDKCLHGIMMLCKHTARRKRKVANCFRARDFEHPTKEQAQTLAGSDQTRISFQRPHTFDSWVLTGRCVDAYMYPNPDRRKNPIQVRSLRKFKSKIQNHHAVWMKMCVISCTQTHTLPRHT